MTKFFKKLGRDTQNFFKKAPIRTVRFFKKMDDNVDKAANFLDDAITTVAPVTRQVGNYLEKYSMPVAEGLAVASTMTPYTQGLAPSILQAGQGLQQGGKVLKDGSKRALEMRDKMNQGRNMYHDYSNAIQNTIQDPMSAPENIRRLPRMETNFSVV